MIRGSTPTHIFTLPFDASQLAEVMVIYAQNDVEVFNKGTDDCAMNGNEIKVTLTQTETLKFSHQDNVQIQIKVKLPDETILVSDVRTVSIGKCLNDEVL